MLEQQQGHSKELSITTAFVWQINAATVMLWCSEVYFSSRNTQLDRI